MWHDQYPVLCLLYDLFVKVGPEGGAGGGGLAQGLGI